MPEINLLSLQWSPFLASEPHRCLLFVIHSHSSINSPVLWRCKPTGSTRSWWQKFCLSMSSREKYHCTSSPFALDNKMSLCRQQYTEGMERGKELMQFVSYPSSAESQWLAQFAPYHLPNSQHCLKPTTTSYCHSSGNLSSCDISVCALHYAIQQLCN